MVHNAMMRDAFLGLSRVAWGYLERKHREGAPLLTREKKRVHWEPIGAVEQTKHEYDLVEFLKRHMSIIRNMPEFEICIDAMRSDGTVAEHLERRVGVFTQCSLLQTRSVPESFLVYLMSEMKSLDFRLSLFEEAYQKLEDFFYTDTIDVEVFTQLEGFVSSSDRLDLGEGWAISKIPDDLYNELLTEGLLGDNLHRSRHALTWHISAEKVILKNDEKFDSPKEYQECEKTTRSVVSALRVFKTGDIGIRRIIHFYQAWPPGIRSRSESYMKPLWGQSYSLPDSQLDDFRNLLDLLRSTTWDPPLSLAIKRLNDAVERQDAYDSILDYIISFEALFLFKSKHKKTALASRVAKIIGSSEHERSTIRTDMKNAYDLRSSIAHGDEESETREELEKTGYSKRGFSELIGGYLRRSIGAYLTRLSQGLNKRQIIKQLEM